MIKVLLVLGNNRIYGTEKYVLDIASHISTLEFDVTVAIPEKGPISDKLKELNLKEFVYSNGKMDIFSKKGILNLFKFMFKNSFNVVHANNGIIPCIIGFFLRTDLRIENKHGLYLEKEIQNYTFLQNFKEKIKNYFVNYTIVTSTHDRNILLKYFSYNNSKIKIISNRIDFTRLKFSRARINNFKVDSIVKICSIGRLTYQKAQEFMIMSMSIIIKKFKHAKLSIVGTGEDEKKLIKLISELGLQNNISILPYTDKVLEFLNENDIFVLTSRFEGVTYAVQEAMGSGIPVVSTFAGGLQDLLVDRKNSMVIPVEDYIKTAEAIIEIIENKELYNRLSINGISAIKENSLSKMIKEIESCYQIK